MRGKSATFWVRFHLTMTFVWAALGIPTMLIWKDSILWVAIMSLYANFIGHWSAMQAAKAEKQGESTSDT